MTTHKGKVSANPRGFGFATTEDGSEFFLAPSFLRKLLPNDVIEFEVEPGKVAGTFQVASAALVSRQARIWMGTLTMKGSEAYLDADETCFVGIAVPKPSGYVDGDVVAVKTAGVSFTQPRAIANLSSVIKGSLSACLGARTREAFDLDYALARAGFDVAFPNDALEECGFLEKMATPESFTANGRLDLSAMPFITVDSATTQDFDDAIYAEPTSKGWLVYVAIADVTHYVQQGSALDTEARRRGTSVYLPGRTVPMLPKVLSANLCALKQGTPRYAVVLKATVTPSGEVLESSLSKALIRVVANRTYDDVAAELEAPGTVANSCVPALYSVYAALREVAPRTVNAGVEDAEPSYQDVPGQSAIKWVRRNDAHKLVEAFMLLANQEVAKTLKAEGFDKLFRHQPTPSNESWGELNEWAQTAGFTLPEAPSREALGELAESLPLTLQLAGQLKIRAAMEPATYHEEEASHFALGFGAYTHFTSPIRRYADLMVHRYLFREQVEDTAVASDCSERSRAAKFAERYVWDKIKKRALAREVSPTARTRAYIVGQSKFGLRVIAVPWQCIVSLSASSLKSNGYAFNESTKTWEGSQELQAGTYVEFSDLKLDEYKAKTELSASLVQVEDVTVTLDLLKKQAACA